MLIVQTELSGGGQERELQEPGQRQRLSMAWRWVDRRGLGKMDRLKETEVTSLAGVWL